MNRFIERGQDSFFWYALIIIIEVIQIWCHNALRKPTHFTEIMVKAMRKTHGVAVVEQMTHMYTELLKGGVNWSTSGFRTVAPWESLYCKKTCIYLCTRKVHRCPNIIKNGDNLKIVLQKYLK